MATSSYFEPSPEMGISYSSFLNCCLTEGEYNINVVKSILEDDPSVFNPDRRTLLLRTPICIALRCNASNDAIRKLLDAGCSPNTCSEHKSVLFCASDHPLTKFNTDILTMLIQAGADLTRCDTIGQSPLCYALRLSTDASFIKLLFNKGCQLDSCLRHASALVCIMHRDSDVLLTEAVVKLLAEQGADPYVQNQEHLSPLDLALRQGAYEIPAIEAMIDFLGKYPTRFFMPWVNTALRSAITNPLCQVSAIELLIRRGANVASKDIQGFTPLHLLISQANCNPAILKLLVNNNTSKNDLVSEPKKSALRLCIENKCDENIVVLLFIGGCRLRFKQLFNYVDIRMVNSKFNSFRTPEMVGFLKLLLKYGLLEQRNFPAQSFERNEQCAELFEYYEACALEISYMKKIEIFPDFTLHNFVVPRIDKLQNPIITSQSRAVSLNRLLIAISGYRFNIYSDIIGAYFSKQELNETLEKMGVKFTSDPNLLPNDKKVILNSDIVLRLCDYLLPGDILKLILAHMRCTTSLNIL